MNAKAEICYYCISGLKFWHQSYTSIIYFSCYKFENKDSKIVVTGYTDAVKSFDDKSLTFWFSLLFSFACIQLVKNESTSFPLVRWRIFDSYLRSWIFCENEALNAWITFSRQINVSTKDVDFTENFWEYYLSYHHRKSAATSSDLDLEDLVRPLISKGCRTQQILLSNTDKYFCDASLCFSLSRLTSDFWVKRLFSNLTSFSIRKHFHPQFGEGLCCFLTWWMRAPSYYNWLHFVVKWIRRSTFSLIE